MALWTLKIGHLELVSTLEPTVFDLAQPNLVYSFISITSRTSSEMGDFRSFGPELWPFGL